MLIPTLVMSFRHDTSFAEVTQREQYRAGITSLRKRHTVSWVLVGENTFAVPQDGAAGAIGKHFANDDGRAYPNIVHGFTGVAGNARGMLSTPARPRSSDFALQLMVAPIIKS